MDVEVSASGVTRQMERDLNIEMGIEKEDDDSGSEEMEKELETVTESSEVEDLRKKVEDMLSNEFHSEVQNKYSEEPSINIDSESGTNRLNLSVVATQSDFINSEMLQAEETVKVDRNSHCSAGDVNCEEECTHGRVRLYSNTCSIRSTSTTASTIAPEEIRSRVKKSLERREKSAQKKRITVKGEASAVTRSRRENMDTIKQCDGIWTWE